MSILNDYGTWAAAFLGAGASVALGFRRVFKLWAGEGRDISRIKAETSVVDLLHGELVRVVAQNQNLAAEIAKLHDLVIQIRTENSRLTASVTLLTTQLEEMRANSEACAAELRPAPRYG